MPYLLDSDILIYYTNGVTRIHDLIEQIAPDGIVISAVSYMETLQGIERSDVPDDARDRLTELLDWVPIVPFTQSEAVQCAELREELRIHGQRVRQRALDLMIAATALVLGFRLVTNNPTDYQDVPGLSLDTPETLGIT